MLKTAAKCVIAGAVALLSFGAAAQDVTLKSRDGELSITGTFLSFDGEFYRVDSDYGVLTVDSSSVRCEGPGCPDLDAYYARLGIAGSAWAIDALMPPLLNVFAERAGYLIETVEGARGPTIVFREDAQELPVAEFDLLPSSNAEGFADLLTEAADMVVATRPADGEEVFLAREAGVGDLTDPIRARVIALDAIGPIVSRSNTVTDISLDELAQVFSGEISTWQDLGNGDAPIQLHMLDVDSRHQSEFTRFVMRPRSAAYAANLTIHTDAAELVAAVERDAYAVGIAPLSAGGSVAPLSLTGACGFQAQGAAADVKSEDYPLTRPVFVYTPARRLPKVAREFLEFVSSPAAQRVVARTRFVDQEVEALPFQRQGVRFANAIAHAGLEVSLDDLQDITAALQGYKRLTLGFRFEDGSTQLDAQSRSNVQLLAAMVEAGVYDGKTLKFVGFSDGLGAAQANRTISERRAGAVMGAVENALGDAFQPDQLVMEAYGFGEAMPLACDDVAWGRRLNRRVEVWIADQR